MLGKRQEMELQLRGESSDSETRCKKRVGVRKEDDAGDTRKEEATSPGATGQLTGAIVGACQEP